MPRKRLFNSETEAAEVAEGGPSHKKRRLDAPSSRSDPQSIKMDDSDQRLRRSARLQKPSPTEPAKASLSSGVTSSKRSQKAAAKPRPSKENEAKVSKKQAKSEKTATPVKRRRKKISPVRQAQVPPEPKEVSSTGQYSETDADGSVWVAMPYVSPDDLYFFSADFYLPPVEKVQVGKEVGPPPVMVRIHIVDKKSGQEVSCENDPQWYYYAVAHILHEDFTPATEPEFLNKSQRSESPMSWYHEEAVEDTRTPVTQTPPPDTPTKRWKTFVTFPSIVIPMVGKYRVRITLGVYIDQRLQTSDGREKTRREWKDLVTITSDPVLVQEFEPDDEDKAVLEARSELFEKFLQEREAFSKKLREQDHETYDNDGDDDVEEITA